MPLPSTECPRWADTITPALESRYRRQLAAVHASVLAVGPRLLRNADIRRWHSLLFEGLAPLDYYAGNYRQDDPDRICLGTDVHVAGVLGSPFPLVVEHMRQLVEDCRGQLISLDLYWSYWPERRRVLAAAKTISTLVCRFIQIHPFVNGNGRLSRFIWRWALLRIGVPAQVRIDPRPGPPYGDLMKAAMQGDVEPVAIALLQHLSRNPPPRSWSELPTRLT